MLKSNQFFRDNSIFFVGSLGVAALNYLYYPVLGRLLGPADFGETQVLVSLFLQSTVFLNVMATVAVNIIANRKDADQANQTVFEIERVTLFVTLVLLTLGGSMIPFLQRFLHFQTFSPFILLGLIIAITVPLTMRAAYLRGAQIFALLAWSGMIGSSVRLISSALLAYLGYRTFGAIAGIIIAQTLALAYTTNAAFRSGFRKPSGFRWHCRPDWKLLSPYFGYSLLILIVSSVTTSWLSLDTLAVKHFFSAETAGLYAGISTISKIIFYVAGSVTTVMLSKIRIDVAPSYNRKILWHSTGLTVLIAGGSALVLSLFPVTFSNLLLGSHYLSAAYLLPSLCALSFILTMLNLFFNYHLALRRWGAAWISLGGGFAVIAALNHYHRQPAEIIDSMLIIGLIMLFVLGTWRVVASRYTKIAYA